MAEPERADTYNVHATWCAGGCPRWLATGAPTCMPYPCRCPETKAAAPEWVQLSGDVVCWWRRKSDGALTSRCPCWGDQRDGKPEDCCAWHMANPAFLDDRHAAFLALVEAAEDHDDDAVKAGPSPEPDPLQWDREEAYGDTRPRVEPYVRRWPVEELHCAHRSDVGEKGVHCTTCCRTFASGTAASMHRPRWTEPCRNPASIRDVDTGVRLLMLNAAGTWSIDWGANVPLWQAAKDRVWEPLSR